MAPEHRPHRLHRRPVGGNRDGHRRLRRALDHDLQRSRHPADPALGGRRRRQRGQLLLIRRVSIFAILLLAYVYYRIGGEAALASIGLLAFAALAQFAPAFFGGLFWKGATSRGAVAGMVSGLAVWAYCLLLPASPQRRLPAAIVSDGPFGSSPLPPALLGLDLPRLTHGVVWSLGVNVLIFLGVSLAACPSRSSGSRRMPS